MQYIEPFYAWRNLYDASEDKCSPFYGRHYNESLLTNTIYNYFIHPQWDEFGSATLYLKILYADYKLRFCVIELLGEWNDCLYNDIMYLKRNFADDLISQGIQKFILIGENVLNFHSSENDYYQEWAEDAEEGWIALLNVRDHVMQEFQSIFVDNYMWMGGPLNQVNWRTLQPTGLLKVVEQNLLKRLDTSTQSTT